MSFSAALTAFFIGVLSFTVVASEFLHPKLLACGGVILVEEEPEE